MKLSKREITLNEADSLKDAFVLEKAIENEYAKVEKTAQRREVINEASSLKKQAEEEVALLRSLWKKSKDEQL